MALRRSRRRRYASIIVVPPERDEPVHLNLPGWAYYTLLGALGALVVMVIGGAILTSWMGVQLRHLRGLEARNLVLAEEAAKVSRLEAEVDEMENLKVRILDLAGVDVREEIEARSAAAAATPPMLESGAAEHGGPRIESASTITFGTMPSLWPVEGVISKEYRQDGDPSALHYGIDIAAPFRSAVRASGAGRVVFAGRDSVFGQLVVIDHGSGVLSYYGHNSELVVGRGDRIRRGQVIAHVGSTGESSAPHVHFEVRKDGKPISPRSFLVD